MEIGTLHYLCLSSGGPRVIAAHRREGASLLQEQQVASCKRFSYCLLFYFLIFLVLYFVREKGCF